MRIGLDIDNTICNTEELFYELANTYMATKNISVEEFNNTHLEDFYVKNILKIINNNTLKPGFMEAFEKISLDNEIIIVTARSDNYIPGFDRMTEATKAWFSSNGIRFDKYYGSCYKEAKAKICVDEKIDLMIDDDFNNYLACKKMNINTLLFDDKKRYLDIADRVESWEEIEKIILNLE